MSKLITPTVGRVVWYWPSQHEIDAASFAIASPTQPLAAHVAFVHDDRQVNLLVIDHAGASHRRTSVKLLQEDDARPHTSEGPFAEWMPYQKGQAALATDLKALETTAAAAAGEALAQVEAQGFERGRIAQHAEHLQQAAPLAIKEGDTGLYTPHNSGEGEPKPPVNALITKVWSATCVNVETETGEQQTSVFVYDGTSERPGGHFFEPGKAAEPQA